MQKEKRVLVTGASRGIGRAICDRLLHDGYSVVGVARTRPDDLPAGMEFHCVDLANHKAVQGFLQEQISGRAYHGLVNNVGIVPLDKLEDVDLDDLRTAVTLNIEVAILFTQALVGNMRKAGLGRVVNISSRAALGKQSRTVYSITKAGIIGMTRTWALELAPFGITVNAIAPGPIETEFFKKANADGDDKTTALLKSIPVGRIGQPRDVAHAVAYFIDERAGYVTGQTHFVCGGMTIGAA